ncbi:N-acetylmuramoyl-L-alanine amidase family protein [Fictibacillus phosphorivorans]|uniref:N-acetylmuramoyl-L-alanine amidase family protein n=1 Tax=Fictibacillus phosphorivorans TaxID=1221500 RepID=UPI0035EC81DD
MSKLISLCDGHGMETAGKRSPNGMRENEFNSRVVYWLDIILRHNGFRTLLVAPTEKDTLLEVRTDISNAKGADLYLSIHANAHLGKWGNARGVETFYYSGSKDGKRLADILQKYLLKGTAQINRGVKHTKNLHVLSETKCVAALIEAAFMDNHEEAELLKTETFRVECATEIAQAVCEYYGITFKPYQKLEPKPITPIKQGNKVLHRVIVNGKQIGAYDLVTNISKQVEDAIKSGAKEIKIEKV